MPATRCPRAWSTALVAALVTSGLPTSRFVFEGFPARTTAAGDRLAELAEQRTIIVYESPHRVARTLIDLTEAFGADRHISVACELTKLHETIVRRRSARSSWAIPRGEYVLVIAGAADRPEEPSTTRSFGAAMREERRNGAPTARRRGGSGRRLGVLSASPTDLAVADSASD